MKAKYTKSFDCNTSEALQLSLNKIYKYKNPQTMYMHRLRINLFYDLMSLLIDRKVIKSFNNAIDIGCNCGFYSKLIADFGFKEIYGIDIDESLILNATDFFSQKNDYSTIHFETLNAEKLDTRKKYDFILCTEVIEHTTNPKQVIKNIKEILTPGGVAVISLPNAFSLPYALTYLFYKLKGKPIDKELYDHLSYPFFKSKKIFEKSNLKLLKTTGTNLFYWNFMHYFPFFGLLNKLNYYLARTMLFKNFSQFYFLVFTKEIAD